MQSVSCVIVRKALRMLAVGLPLVIFSRLAWAKSVVSPSEQRVRLVDWRIWCNGGLKEAGRQMI